MSQILDEIEAELAPARAESEAQPRVPNRNRTYYCAACGGQKWAGPGWEDSLAGKREWCPGCFHQSGMRFSRYVPSPLVRWVRRKTTGVAGFVRRCARLVKPVSLTVLYSLGIAGVCIAYAIATVLAIVLVAGAGPIVLTALAGWCAWHVAGGIQRGFNGLPWPTITIQT